MGDPTPDLPRLLKAASRQVSDMLEQRLTEACGLPAVQWRALAAIGANDGITPTDIAALTGVHKVQVSRAVASLLDLRLVRRRDDPNDRRSFHLRATRRGAALMERARSVIPDLEADLAARLTVPELRVLQSALERLREPPEMEDAA